jgi:hypothetical protein
LAFLWYDQCKVMHTYWNIWHTAMLMKFWCTSFHCYLHIYQMPACLSINKINMYLSILLFFVLYLTFAFLYPSRNINVHHKWIKSYWTRYHLFYYILSSISQTWSVIIISIIYPCLKTCQVIYRTTLYSMFFKWRIMVL